jgi:hypothetical protein
MNGIAEEEAGSLQLRHEVRVLELDVLQHGAHESATFKFSQKAMIWART